MFETLDDRIKHDNALEISRKERILEGLLISILSVLLFGGLYIAILMVSG